MFCMHFLWNFAFFCPFWSSKFKMQKSENSIFGHQDRVLEIIHSKILVKWGPCHRWGRFKVNVTFYGHFLGKFCVFVHFWSSKPQERNWKGWTWHFVFLSIFEAQENTHRIPKLVLSIKKPSESVMAYAWATPRQPRPRGCPYFNPIFPICRSRK